MTPQTPQNQALARALMGNLQSPTVNHSAIIEALLQQRQQQKPQGPMHNPMMQPDTRFGSGYLAEMRGQRDFRRDWKEQNGHKIGLLDYTSIGDMFDGGGPGQSGDTFQGGKFSGALNLAGVKPAAPNVEGMADVAAGGRKVPASVMQALLEGAPNYRRGTNFHPGGMAVVGENGPEAVNLPRGAQVMPSGGNRRGNRTIEWLEKTGNGDLAQAVASGQMEMRGAMNLARDRQNAPAGVDPYEMNGPASNPQAHQQWLQQQVDQMSPEELQRLREYDPASQQRLRQNPGAMQPAPMDMRELIPQEESRFNDAAAYRTADLDAFKMMQLQPDYDEPVSHDANATEARRLQLLRRAMFADAALEDPRLSQAMTRIDNNLAGKMGAIGRLYTDDNYELGRTMAEQFSSAILRGDSGAQTPEPEVKRYIRQYFPLPNETPDQIAAKKSMRREEIRAMIQSLPEDARPAVNQIMAEINELKRQADVPDGSLTGGAAPLSDDDKEFLKSLGLE